MNIHRQSANVDSQSAKRAKRQPDRSIQQFEPDWEQALLTPDDLVEANPFRPWLFKGLGSEIGLVAKLSAADAFSYFRGQVTKGEFRVFNKDDQVERLSFPEFLRRSENHEFAYLETSSWDPAPPSAGIARRGDHLLDSLPAEDLSPRPLSQACGLERVMKTRCYLRLTAAEQPMIVGWHYDGFDQVILNALGCGTKVFEISPPTTDELLSGWLREEEEPATRDIATLRLAAGDVLYLPARWRHRVVTTSQSMTVNWGFYASQPDLKALPLEVQMPRPSPPHRRRGTGAAPRRSRNGSSSRAVPG